MSVDVAYDTDVWIGIPSEWGDDTWPDAGAWAREAAEAVCGRGRRGRKEVEPLAAVLAMVASSPLNSAAMGQVGYVHQPEPGAFPLPVWVQVLEAEGDRDAALRELALADDEAVEPPVVEAFSTDTLGEGLRVLRYTATDDDLLVAGLHYAHRCGDVDVHVWTSCPEPARLLAVIDDIDELVRGVSVVDD